MLDRRNRRSTHGSIAIRVSRAFKGEVVVSLKGVTWVDDRRNQTTVRVLNAGTFAGAV